MRTTLLHWHRKRCKKNSLIEQKWSYTFPFFSFPRCTFALHLIRLNSQLWQISFFSSSPHPFFFLSTSFGEHNQTTFSFYSAVVLLASLLHVFFFRFLSDTAASTFSATSASAAPTFTHTTSSLLLLLLSSLLRALMFCRASRSALHLQTPNSQLKHTPLSIGA